MPKHQNLNRFFAEIVVLALEYAGHFSCDLQEENTEQKAIDKMESKANFFIRIFYILIDNKYIVNCSTKKKYMIKVIYFLKNN
jgi:hypothetical protein